MEKINCFYKYLQAYSCAVRNSKMYFYTKGHELIQIDLETYDTRFVNEDFTEKNNNIVHSVFCVSDRLYYINRTGEMLVEAKTGKSFPLLQEKNEKVYVFFAVQDAEYIYILYSNGMLFSKIDVNNERFEVANLDRDLHIAGTDAASVDYVGLHNDKIFVFQKSENQMLCYDLKGCSSEVILLPDILGKCMHIAVEKDRIIVLNQESKIYSWNTRGGDIRLLYSFDAKEPVLRSYNRMHIFKDKVILLPGLMGNDILILDKDYHSREIYAEYPKGFAYNMGDSYKYVRYAETESEILYPMRSANYILIISKETGDMRWIQPDIKSVQKMMAEYQRTCAPVIFMPEDMISFKAESMKNAIKDRNTIGKQIWKQVYKACNE